MKRVLFLIIILIITIKGAIAQGENLVKDGSFENADRVKSDFNYSQGWGYGNYTITDQVVSKWGSTFVDPKGSTGRFLIVDVSPSKKQRLWYDSITIKPNTTYSFTCLIANVFAPVNNNQRENTPVIQLNVNEKKVSRVINLISMSNEEWKTEWKTISGQFTSGPDQTRIEISVVDKEWGKTGNDVAIDNISFAEIENTLVVKEKKNEVLPVVVKEEPLPADSTPVVVKAPEIKDPEKIEDIVTVKADPVKSDSVVPEKVVKEEKPVLVSAEIKKTDEKKTIVTPKIEKKVTVPKKEITAPIVTKKTIVAPVTVKKKDKTPAVVKIEPEQKKTEPVKPKTFSSNIKISDVKVNEILELSHIYFEKGKSYLLPDSYSELKDLVKFMKENTTVRIRLEGHTESGGDSKKNKVLSENRVIEVKKYLVGNGIETGRIEWIGHGGEKPLYVGDDEEKKKLNRRVEVVVIGK